MKFYFVLLTLFAFCPAFAETSERKKCEASDVFLPYRAGLKEEKNNQHSNAFDIYCQLAYRGDYRSQFKLAKYLYNGIPGYVDVDYRAAYLWAKVSNSVVKSKKRQSFITKVQESVGDYETLNKEYLSSLQNFPSGSRIDMEYESLDYEKILKKMQKARTYTGSNIKREEPALNLRVIDN